MNTFLKSCRPFRADLLYKCSGGVASWA